MHPSAAQWVEIPPEGPPGCCPPAPSLFFRMPLQGGCCPNPAHGRRRVRPCFPKRFPEKTLPPSSAPRLPGCRQTEAAVLRRPLPVESAPHIPGEIPHTLACSIGEAAAPPPPAARTVPPASAADGSPPPFLPSSPSEAGSAPFSMHCRAETAAPAFRSGSAATLFPASFPWTLLLFYAKCAAKHAEFPPCPPNGPQ